MAEFAVTIVLREQKVSAETPEQALAAATQQVAADVNGNTASAHVEKVDRIKVTGLERR